MQDEVTILQDALDQSLILAGCWFDISTRRQAETELRKLSRVIEQSPLSVLITDLEGRIEYVNPCFTATTGYTFDEVRGQSTRLLKSGKVPPEMYRNLWETITAGRNWQGEIINRKKSGELLAELVSISPVTNNEGRATHYVAVRQNLGERKQMEQALRESEERYRMIATHTKDMIWIGDVKTGLFVYVSPASTHLCGYTPEELTGKPRSTLYTPAMSDFLARHLPGRIAAFDKGDMAEKDWTYELDYLHKNGAVIATEVVTTLIPDETGVARQIIGVTRDITERKRVAQALSREKRSLDAASQSGKVALWEWHILAERLDLSGYTDPLIPVQAGHSLTREDILGLIHPDDQPLVRQALVAHLERGTPFVTEFRIQRRDGSYAWWRNVGNVERDDHGNPIRMAGACIDITELKRTEQELLANRERLEQAQALALLGTWALNLRTGSFIRSAEIDAIFEKNMMTTGPDIERFLASVHPEDRSQVQTTYTESLKVSTPRELDHRLLMPDGRVKWIRSRWKSEFDADGLPRAITGTIQDITDHMMAREARALAEAKAAAEEANQAKSRFLANISHEIRTPMNAILGFSQIMLDDAGLTVRQRKHLKAINRSGEHLLELINDVLEMSKIEASRIVIHHELTDLPVLLNNLAAIFQLKAKEKGLSLVIEKTPDLPPRVTTDDKRLMQILINLVGNAVKFTQRGGITVKMSGQPVPEQKLRLMVDIEDTGPGIEAVDLPRLFQRFEQTRTGQESVTGTGLGLAISRSLARLLGGDITVESRVGIGSVFHLTILVRIPESPLSLPRVSATRVFGLAPRETRRKVLVVDDVPLNRELLSEMLSPLGFEIETANDGRKGVELAFSWKPDIILMDIRMPEMDGHEAIRHIRKHEQAKRTPIIAVTASAMEDQRLQAIGSGADDFVSKPFLKKELVAKIGFLLKADYSLKDQPPPGPGASQGLKE